MRGCSPKERRDRQDCNAGGRISGAWSDRKKRGREDPALADRSPLGFKFKKTSGSEDLSDLFTKNPSMQVGEAHVKGLGCTFDVAAQLHAIEATGRISANSLVQWSTVVRQNGKDECDWTGTDQYGIDQLILHSERKNDKSFVQVCKC